MSSAVPQPGLARDRRSIRLEAHQHVWGDYPAAVVANGLVFTSGARAQSTGLGFVGIPEAAREREQGFALVDAAEGLTSESSWGAHESLEAILQAAGSDNLQILRQHVWQTDKRFFPCYEKVRMHWQPVPAPSSGLGVSAVPPGAVAHRIGLDAIAVAPGASTVFTAREVMAAVDHSALPSASHYSQAVRSGPLVFTAGHIPIRTSEPGKPVVSAYADVPPEGRLFETGRSHPDSRDGPIAAQTWYVYEQLRQLLASSGLGLNHAILATVYLADLRDFAMFHRVHCKVFGKCLPALCVAGLDEVGHRGTRIEIELTVLDPKSGLRAENVAWPGAAPFAGPACVRVGGFAFLAGIPGFDQHGRMAGADSALASRVADQSRAAFTRLGEVLREAGLGFSDLVKLTLYLRREADLASFESVRGEFLDPASLPAFECVCVHGPGPVQESELQIEAIAAGPA